MLCILVLIYQSYRTSHPLWQQNLRSLPRETANITNPIRSQMTTDFTCGYTWTNFWPNILMLYLRHMEFDRAALLLRTGTDPIRLYIWSLLLAEIVRGFPQSLQANVRILLQTTQPFSFLILTNSLFIYQQEFRCPQNTILQVFSTNRTR